MLKKCLRSESVYSQDQGEWLATNQVERVINSDSGFCTPEILHARSFTNQRFWKPESTRVYYNLLFNKQLIITWLLKFQLYAIESKFWQWLKPERNKPLKESPSTDQRLECVLANSCSSLQPHVHPLGLKSSPSCPASGMRRGCRWLLFHSKVASSCHSNMCLCVSIIKVEENHIKE